MAFRLSALAIRGGCLGGALIVAAIAWSTYALGDQPCADPRYEHGISHLRPLKYDRDFTHFAYVNPDAPKAGEMRISVLGTFDNYNGIVEKGRLAAGYDITRRLVYDTLLEPAIDEPVSHYGRLAEGVVVGPDFEWVAFRLRSGATWHDGVPITVEDVLFTFDAMQEHGSVAIRTSLADLDRVFAFGERELCFVRKEGVEINPTFPFTLGSFSILPKHYWSDRDIGKTTVQAPLGSGPYRLARAEVGRVLVYERFGDYWGRDLPVNSGRYNFQRVKFDHFADEQVMIEAHKGNVIDIREEGVSKNWATQYNFPAVKAGLFKRELRPLARIEGLWWPIFWNLDKPHLKDVRVREALWLLYDFAWTNRVLFYGFYRPGVSFFQNSPMAQRGLPSEKELSLLEPWRDQVPPRVFTEEFRQPSNDGPGSRRQNLKRALKLFEEAGWRIADGRMRNIETGEPFTLDFIGVSYYSIRQNLSLVRNLNRIGIETTGVSPEVSQWLYRSRTGKFDGNSVRLGPTFTPGLQLRNWFSSAAADHDYGQNWARVRSPLVDSLIQSVIEADTAEDLYAATRALDRVLLWNFYFIPLGSQPGFRLVRWDKFSEVRDDALTRVPYLDAWWWDEAKARRVETGLRELAAGE
ncbi:MAG: extracellular solute-binding protein [Gammaproteobacteria bacterium]|nr:extracellular solute-binding protein [Gammaproteobacteria bacterium]